MERDLFTNLLSLLTNESTSHFFDFKRPHLYFSGPKVQEEFSPYNIKTKRNITKGEIFKEPNDFVLISKHEDMTWIFFFSK